MSHDRQCGDDQIHISLWAAIAELKKRIHEMHEGNTITITIENVTIINGGAMDFTRVNAALAKNTSIGELFGTIYEAIAAAIRDAGGNQAKLNALADQLEADNTVEGSRVAALKDLITPPPPSLAAVWNGPLAGVVGESFSGAVAADGGTAPYTYVQDSGAVPDGCTFGADGSVSGTLAAAGEFSFGGSVTDAAGASAAWSGAVSVS